MSELTPQQENLITLLIVSKTITEACEQAGITTATYYLWLKEPEFKEKLKQEISAAFFEARQKIRKASCRAVEVLEKLLDCKEINQRRLSALAILDFAFKDKNEELESRLERLERLVNERKANNETS